MFIWIWIAVACGVVFLWIKNKLLYFKKHGLRHRRARDNFMDLIKLLTKQEHFSTSLEATYNSFPNERFIGSWEMFTPVIFLRDPEIIRRVGVKEFDHFTNHRNFANQEDFFFNKSLIGLKGQKWRDMRSTLSPAFTGSKLRNMVPLIQECSADLLDYLLTQIETQSEKYLDVDTQDLITRYTSDVIATCAFGLKTNSIKDRDNEFYKMGKKLTNFGFKQLLTMFLITIFPFISKIMTIHLFPEDAINTLSQIVLDTMKARDEKKIYRPDMIQLLLEARKGTLSHEQVKDEKDAGFATVEESLIGKNTIKQVWDDDHLVAQAILFFFAGFETVSISLKFMMYELAINPDIQDKLRQEIDEFYEKYDGRLDYDKINQMQYLDMVLSETLRKWPPAIALDRECNKTYNLGKANDDAEQDFILAEKSTVFIPVWGFHRDAKYYENPEKFDPERFSDENKHNIKPFTYLPFGIGPRNCIGSRFALIEGKVLMCGLLRRFELGPAPQTIIPPKMDPGGFNMRLEGGHWLRFKSRR